MRDALGAICSGLTVQCLRNFENADSGVDYKSLRALVARRRSLRHALEKEELRILRLVNKDYWKSREATALKQPAEKPVRDSLHDDENDSDFAQEERKIFSAFEADCHEDTQLWVCLVKFLISSLAMSSGSRNIPQALHESLAYSLTLGRRGKC